MSTAAVSTTNAVAVVGIGPVEVVVEKRGTGRPFLVLHGGAGPQSVAGFAELLAEKGGLVVTPTHPGFGGTERPDGLNTVASLAALYVTLLDDLELENVTVIGNSVGGWIAAEMALLKSPRMSRLVLLDAVGIEVDGHPVANVAGLSGPAASHRAHAPDGDSRSGTAKHRRLEPTTAFGQRVRPTPVGQGLLDRCVREFERTPGVRHRLFRLRPLGRWRGFAVGRAPGGSVR